MAGRRVALRGSCSCSACPLLAMNRSLAKGERVTLSARARVGVPKRVRAMPPPCMEGVNEGVK